MLTEIVHEEINKYNIPDYDGIWKKIIKDLFEEFMLFFAPDLHKEINFNIEPDFLQQELFKEIIQGKKGKNIADQIVKVHLKNGEDKWILIHIEVQDKTSSEFTKRMFRYFYRIYDKFEKEVYAIALLTNNQPSAYPDSFHYNFFGTVLDYKYNVYKFHDKRISELEKSANPFALAVIAGKYASKYKDDSAQRLHFKIKLMKQVIQRFKLSQENSRLYLTALFYFIDYLLHTPNEYEKELRREITEFIRKDGEEQMHAEEEILSPTLAGVLEILKQEELEKAKTAGSKAAKREVALKLIAADFSDKEIAELSGLGLTEIANLRKPPK